MSGRNNDNISSLQDKIERLEKKVADLENKLDVAEIEGRSEAYIIALRNDLAAKENNLVATKYEHVELMREKNILMEMQKVSGNKYLFYFKVIFEITYNMNTLNDSPVSLLCHETAIRPISPRKRDAVFIICSSVEGVNEYLGTAFAVTSRKVITAFHNLVHENEDAKYLLYCSLAKSKDDEILYPTYGVPVSLVACDKTADWAVLSRIDSQEFSSSIPVCPEDKLPIVSLDSRLTVYFAALGLLSVHDTGMKTIKIWNDEVRVLQYDGEHDSQIILSGGKCRGSCGAPIVDLNGFAVGFHTDSFNEYDESESATPVVLPGKGKKQKVALNAEFLKSFVDQTNDALSVASSQRSHADFSRGSVLCKLVGLEAALV